MIEGGVRKEVNNEAQALLQVENLSSSWSASGEQCLSNVSLEATAGQLLGITGPAGSGKVTHEANLGLIDLAQEGLRGAFWWNVCGGA